MHNITPCLWFDGNGKEAAEFYVSVFPNSRITDITYSVEGEHVPEGQVLTVLFEIEGKSYMALNGGPQFKFNEAVSLIIYCEDQAEIDRLWDKLREGGGEEGPCGWLKDRFGFSWQVVPTEFMQLQLKGDKAGVARAFKAMYAMKKLDIAKLKAAYEGRR